MENYEMRSKLLTREMLENYGITNITEDGQVFRDDKAVKICIAQKNGKYKVQQPYARFVISDKSRKLPKVNKKGQKYWTYAPITFLVSRAVYAWYYGEVPAGLEVDHIDENTLNNNLSNLRLLTKEENLTRKKVSRNQYNYWKTDEEILAEREGRKYIYDRETHKAVKAEWWTAKLKEKKKERAKKDATKDQWHSLNAELKAKIIERRAVHKTGDIETWRKLGIEINALKLAILKIQGKMKNGHC